MDLADLIREAASAHGDRIAFQMRRGFRTERWTFRAAGDAAARTAGWLSAQGVEAGDRVAVWAPNQPAYALLCFGVWLAGAVLVPVDVRTRQEVAERFLAAARPCLGFTSRAAPGRMGDRVGRELWLEDLVDLCAGARPLDPVPRLGPDDLAEILFTSGTTSAPKGVLLTRRNLAEEVGGLEEAFPLDPSYRGLSLLPLSHVFEQAIDLLLAFRSGVRITYVPRVNSATVLRTMREDRTVGFVAVPQLLRVMLQGMERHAGRRRWRLAHELARRLPVPLRRLLFRPVLQRMGGHLRLIGSGGAPLERAVAEAWERMGVQVFEGYGLTEVAGAATLNTPNAKRLGTVGRALPGVEVRTADDGEVLLRGGTVSPGYLDDPERTAGAFAGGWFRTGDVGHVDALGFLHLSGRQAFRIVLPNGQNVYPEDLERTLNAQPAVRESCVVGLPADGAERPFAVLLPEDPAGAAEAVERANAHLGPHQRIREWSLWRQPDFPRKSTLEVDRQRVRRAVEAEREGGGRPERAGPEPDALTAILARMTSRSPGEVRGDARLERDLGLDSLDRVELLTAIEEELGAAVDEASVTPETTVTELRHLVEHAGAVPAAPRRLRWPRSRWAGLLRPWLLAGVFRLQDRWMRMEVVHPERTAIPLPALLIFNYQGPYVPLFILRALPEATRQRVALAVDARLWQGPGRWQGWLASMATQAFPFVKSGGPVRSALEELGRWLDDGYAVVVSPEGNPERGGQLLPFLPGTGLAAVEMQVPVVPFRVDGYHRLFPPPGQAFPYLPTSRGSFRLIVGEPITFPPGTPYEEATEQLRRAMVEVS